MSQNRRWIALFYFVSALLVWVLTDKLLTQIMAWTSLTDFNYELLSERFTLTTLLGLTLALVMGIRMYRSPKYSGLLNEVIVELRKVTWPNAHETRSATIVVLVTVFIMAFLLGLFDFFWSSVMDWLYPSVTSV
ncbi:MAG: preprotein translocase subunit SecE [Deltaproteobacteria bacterium]|nr:preprotein translocase subunit SecE [Deltaproteobacteria bacterium]